jgi:hypothetical protein
LGTMDDSCSRSQQDSSLWLYDKLPSFVDDGWFSLTITTGFIPLDLMIIWRASFLCGWWMILAHDHNRIHSPGLYYDYMTSFLPSWMMDDDSCSPPQTDFPWLCVSRASFCGWWMNDSLLTTIHDSPGGYDCHKLLLWMMDESYSPTNHNWSPQWISNHQHTMLDGWMDGWMVYTQKNSFLLYSCINIAIHGPERTSTH